MLVLNDLRDKHFSSKKRKRVGRGYSGKRPGHGGKGQTARSGVALGSFEGGQNPITRRLPKQISFYTPDAPATVSLETIQRLVESNRLDSSNTIDFQTLKSAGVIRKAKKFRVVGKCSISLKIEAFGFSTGARESITKHSGEAKVLNEA
jgi:large subunit ribosomal protein L15